MIIFTRHLDALFNVEQIDFTSFPDVTSVLRQAHLDATLYVVGSACQKRASSLPDVICSALFQCVNCVWFVTVQSYFFDWLKVKGLRNFSIMCYELQQQNINESVCYR